MLYIPKYKYKFKALMYAKEFKMLVPLSGKTNLYKLIETKEFTNDYFLFLLSKKV
jgi:hypothetical protein